MKSGTVSISSYAFWRSKITGIVIPKEVECIGNFAFSECTSLSKVSIEDVTSWYQIKFGNETSNPMNRGAQLYLNQELLTELTIPEDATLSDYAFYNCKSLQKVTFPNKVTKIGENAFYNVNAAVYIEDLKSWCSNEAIQSTPTCSLGFYVNGEALTRLTIPNGVDAIRAGAFQGCPTLKLVTIPEGVVTIGDNVFNGCGQLQKVTLPDTLEYIGYRAFYSTGLKSVKIPSAIIEIGDEAFYQCSLDSLYLPSLEAWMDSFAWAKGQTLNGRLSYVQAVYVNNVLLEDLVIPAGYDVITSSVFGNFPVKSITIPGTVKEIGNYAFWGCQKLEKLTISEGVQTIATGAFSYCFVLGELTFPESLTDIGRQAFFNCLSLQVLTIPGTVETIGNQAFGACFELKHVTFLTDMPQCGVDVFSRCPKLTSFAFPIQAAGANANILPSTAWIGGTCPLGSIYYQGTEEQWQEQNVTLSYPMHYNVQSFIPLASVTTDDYENYNYNFIMHSLSPVSGTFVIALYDDQGLIDIRTEVMSQGATSYISEGGNFVSTERIPTKFKIFFWNNLDDVQPICPGFEDVVI